FFINFSDPAISPSGSVFSFVATAQTNVSSDFKVGIWWQRDDGPLQNAVAFLGDAQPDVPLLPGVPYPALAVLNSVGTTDLGPIFTGKIGNGYYTGDTFYSGLWALDSNGSLRLLLLADTPLEGKVIADFTVLSGVPGSLGVRHSYTGDGRVIVRVTYTDGSKSLVKVTLP